MVSWTPMGCGASVMAPYGRRRDPKQHARRRSGGFDPPPGERPIVTPPTSIRGGPPGNIVLPPENMKVNLHIQSALAPKLEPGMADTPVGKAADEYKYFCPLCMCVPNCSQPPTETLSACSLSRSEHACSHPRASLTHALSSSMLPGCFTGPSWRQIAAANTSARFA